MLRNLGKMSAVGLVAPASEAARFVAARLADKDRVRAARLHPIQLLLALKVYALGHGLRGGLAWTPAPEVLDALDAAFEASFAEIVPTGQRILVAVDVSGSMHGSRCAGSPALACLDAAGAVAMQVLRTEKGAQLIAFDTQAHEPGLSRRQRLDDVVASLRRWQGGTDVAQPVLYALERKLAVDAFVVVTDNETWAGREHPVQALGRYRAAVNPQAKIAVLAVAANPGSVVHEDDALAFGASGFDAAVPTLLADFLRGTFAGATAEDSEED
jgi:60 kDa SS-A/Ro ribonucleoprotein